MVGRDELLAAAAAEIRTQGPDVTMEEIAAAATVTKPILYRTIGDKQALTTALAETLIDRINETVAQHRGSSREPRADFESAVRGYLTAIDDDRNLFLFVNGGSRDTDLVRRLVDRSAARLVELFTDARRAGDREAATARTWAYAIVGAFQVVTLMWLRDGYSDLDTIADDLTQLLWPGVAQVGN